MDESLLNRQMPQALDAEQALLGSILIDSQCMEDVVGLVQPEDFYFQQNRDIYETAYSMFNLFQVIDVVTLLNKMRDRGVAQENTPDYLAQLMNITPSAAKAREYALIVQETSMLRGLAQAAGEIQQSVFERTGTPSEILEMAEKKIYALRNGQNADNLEPIATVMHKYFDRLMELAASDSAIPGLSTGLRDLDSKINGLNKGNLILIAARPAMGKTSFALNIAANVAKKYNLAVAIFSLEMSKDELAMRLVSGESFVDSQTLATGKLSEEEWERLGMGAAALSQTQLRLNDNSSITVAQMNAELRRVKNLGLVIIDYLQLIGSAGYGKTSENRVTEVSTISRSLKIMAKDLGVPVVCLSQLNRAAESRTDKRPMLSDLRESGAIEQDADAVLMLYRDEYYNPNTEDKNITECIVAKNRHGQVGTVKLQWMSQFTTFSDLEWKHDS